MTTFLTHKNYVMRNNYCLLIEDAYFYKLKNPKEVFIIISSEKFFKTKGISII